MGDQIVLIWWFKLLTFEPGVGDGSLLLKATFVHRLLHGVWVDLTVVHVAEMAVFNEISAWKSASLQEGEESAFLVDFV